MEAPLEAIESVDNRLEIVGLVMIRTEKELDTFLSSSQVTRSLIICCSMGTRTIDISKAISKSAKTLERLTVDGCHAAKSTIAWQHTQQLADAISKCTSLTVLKLVNYQNAFQYGIKYVVEKLSGLENITDVSFDNTYLGRHCETLFTSLHDKRNLGKLYLNRCAMTSDQDFINLSILIKNHPTLHTIDLGDSPIWGTAMQNLLKAFAANNQIMILMWEPLKFPDSEELYYELCSEINWERDPAKIESFLQQKERIENYRKTGHHGLLPSYQKAVAHLAKLQSLITERQSSKFLTTLEFCIRDYEDIDFVIIMIMNNADHLKKIELTLNPKCYSDYPTHIVQSFAAALAQCKQLETFKLLFFQTQFTYNIEFILRALAELPKFRNLELIATYLSEKGAEVLVDLLRTDRLTSLNLTRTGFINTNCFMSLANGLEKCRSLRNLVLGDTPMTASWIRIIIRAIDVALPPAIVWCYNDVASMNSEMTSMCNHLKRMFEHPYDVKPPSNNDDFDSIAQIFRSQNIDELTTAITELHRFQRRHGMKIAESPQPPEPPSWWSSKKSTTTPPPGHQELEIMRTPTKRQDYGTTRPAKK